MKIKIVVSAVAVLSLALLPAMAHPGHENSMQTYSVFWIGTPPKTKLEAEKKLANTDLGKVAFVSKLKVTAFHTLTNNGL